MDLIKNLNKFGLSEKESKVYLALLELGEACANDIAIKSDLPRTLVYDLLERLIDLGIVSYSIKENRKSFTASSPKELLRIIKEKEKAVNEIMPNLEELQKIKGVKRPLVKIYEGKEGMKTVMNDLINSKIKEFFSYGSSRSSWEIMPAFLEEWHKKRIKRKIAMKSLYNDTLEIRERLKRNIKYLGYITYKFMPIKFESPTVTVIYGKKVVIQSWSKDPFAIMIESSDFAENQRRHFNELWKIARK